MKPPSTFAAAMVARTHVIDELVLQAVREGCDVVLNLAAGLDTRPYRLDLPRVLRWIEVDLPALLEEKTELLAGETPGCALERIAADVVRDRRSILAAVRGERVLAITEGLVGYLPESDQSALGRDLAAHDGVRWWMTDLSSPRILEMMQKRVGDELARSPLLFAPGNGVAFFEALGWRAREIRPLFREAIELGRIPFHLRPLAWLPEPNPRKLGRSPWAAVVRFEVDR
jgi:methyltransferase (TIGR00027 family)